MAINSGPIGKLLSTGGARLADLERGIGIVGGVFPWNSLSSTLRIIFNFLFFVFCFLFSFFPLFLFFIITASREPRDNIFNTCIYTLPVACFISLQHLLLLPLFALCFAKSILDFFIPTCIFSRITFSFRFHHLQSLCTFAIIIFTDLCSIIRF